MGKVHTTSKYHYQQRTSSMTSDNGKPQTVDREYVRKYLAGLRKPEYAKCRGNRHAFPDRGKTSLPDPEDNSVVERVTKCRRCKVTRTEILHVDNQARTAHQFSVKYSDYPEGYRMEPGHGRLDSDGYGMIRYENLLNEIQQQAGGR